MKEGVKVIGDPFHLSADAESFYEEIPKGIGQNRHGKG